MNAILEAIDAWINALLMDAIEANFENVFESMNLAVSDVAGQVGQTPSQWNSSVFLLVKNLSDTVIMPIAGMILTFVMCYELIQMIIDRNNLNDFPPSDIFKWMMKTFIAVTIVSNTFNIIMGIFDVAQSVVSSAASVILSSTNMADTAIDALTATLSTMDTGVLLGLYLQSFMIGFAIKIMSLCIFVIVYGRMLEIYLVTSLGAIPLATMTSKEWNMGQNYIKAVLALAFQAFLIMVCVGIYAVLVQSIALSSSPISAIWQCMGYMVLLCFALFKTGSLAKSIFGAH